MEHKLDANIYTLLESMSGRNNSGSEVRGSDQVSWQAHRTSEKIADLKYVPSLLDFIDTNDDKEIKLQAYQLLGSILKNTTDSSLSKELLSRLKKEDSNDDSLYVLIMGLWWSNTKLQDHVDSVIYYIDDERELIRNGAIRLLANFNSNQEKIETALIEIIKDPYDFYDQKYAIESLGFVGLSKSFDFLKSTEANDPEIIEGIKYSINQIKPRV